MSILGWACKVDVKVGDVLSPEVDNLREASCIGGVVVDADT